MRRLFGIVLLLLFAAPSLRATAADPTVPHGLDPGGPAIALIADGVDYTDPEIATRLARDGEGEPIGLDLVDGDVRPYRPAGESAGTEIAKQLLAAHPHARLIVVRASMQEPASLARAMIFVSRTPANVAAIALSATSLETMAVLEKAASVASTVVFALPSGLPATNAPNLIAATPPNTPSQNEQLRQDDFVDFASQLACLVETGTAVLELREKLQAPAHCDPATRE